MLGRHTSSRWVQSQRPSISSSRTRHGPGRLVPAEHGDHLDHDVGHLAQLHAADSDPVRDPVGRCRLVTPADARRRGRDRAPGAGAALHGRPSEHPLGHQVPRERRAERPQVGHRPEAAHDLHTGRDEQPDRRRHRRSRCPGRSASGSPVRAPTCGRPAPDRAGRRRTRTPVGRSSGSSGAVMGASVQAERGELVIGDGLGAWRRPEADLGRSGGPQRGRVRDGDGHDIPRSCVCLRLPSSKVVPDRSRLIARPLRLPSFAIESQFDQGPDSA